jgi:DNA-binding beta-propeller fold protein YncE
MKLVLLLYGCVCGLSLAQQDQPVVPLSYDVPVPGHPFGIVSSTDGQWVFVALADDISGGSIAVLQRGDQGYGLVRTIPLPSGPTGIVMTHDGQLLVAAAGDSVIFLDVGRMTLDGVGAVLGSLSDGSNAGSVAVNVTADDLWLYVCDENMSRITVIDLNQARANGFSARSIVGRIPVGVAPTAITFSTDGQWMYSTSEVAPPYWGWPKACKQEGQGVSQAIVNPQGAVVVVNVATSSTNPAGSVASLVPAGCSPVRLAMSPDGGRLYVTARNNNALLALDTGQFFSNPAGAVVGTAQVGAAPVPVAVIDSGRHLIVGNSNRFDAPATPQTLSVLDAAKIEDGSGAVVGTLPAGIFPRELTLSADGQTLFLANYGSYALQVMDVPTIESSLMCLNGASISKQ